jgi:fumarate hydratase class II
MYVAAAVNTKQRLIPTVTALTPVIGYEKSSQIAHYALTTILR